MRAGHGNESSGAVLPTLDLRKVRSFYLLTLPPVTHTQKQLTSAAVVCTGQRPFAGAGPAGLSNQDQN